MRRGKKPTERKQDRLQRDDHQGVAQMPPKLERRQPLQLLLSVQAQSLCGPRFAPNG